MCGLIAAFTHDTTLEPRLREALERMHRRGSDGEGFWREGGVYLGHRRLAILDLDPRANQPMTSSDGRYVIVFNGEIYDLVDLRHELATQSYAFRSQSGAAVAASRLSGMGGRKINDACHADLSGYRLF